MKPVISKGRIFRFQLYVAGEGPNSLQAITNLNRLCKAHLPGRNTVEIVDVFRHPDRALKDGIFMTPTLVKLGPLPLRRIVGSLSDTQAVLQAIGLESAP
ncbi:MAG: circadian clock KaiB family protein [Acidobacteriota bacterium]